MPSIERKLNMSLAELELSVRATNCLESENIHTVRDLVIRSEDELLEVRNFGETTLNEVREKLIGTRAAVGHASANVDERLSRNKTSVAVTQIAAIDRGRATAKSDT